MSCRHVLPPRSQSLVLRSRRKRKVRTLATAANGSQHPLISFLSGSPGAGAGRVEVTARSENRNARP